MTDIPEVHDFVTVQHQDGNTYEGRVLAVTGNGFFKVDYETLEYARSTGLPKRARGMFRAEKVELLRRDG